MASEFAMFPGTVRLESHRSTKIVLQPTPTDDPNDPLNWSAVRKTLNFVLACFYSLMTFVLLDIGPIIWGNLNEELGISYSQLNNSWAINCAGLAIGCIFLYPIANKYGRRPIYILSLIVQLAGAIWFAKMKTNWENLVINFVVGFGGAISEAVVQMTIADLFFTHQRASANATYFFVVTVGTFLAPVAAGYSAVSQGWRWIWWWCAILLGANLVVVVLFFEESKYILTVNSTSIEEPATGQTEQPAFTPDKKVADAQSHSADIDRDHGGAMGSYHRKTYRERLALFTTTDVSLVRHMYQPFIVLFTFPAVAYTAVMYGANLAWFSVCGTTSSTYLLAEPYNFNSAGIGLFSLAPFIGSVLAFFYAGPLVDWYIVWKSKRNNGIFEPEMRLHLALPCIVLSPLGLLVYGLSLAHGLHWIVLAVGYGIYGFVLSVMSDLSLTYELDCYQDIIGDTLVAVAFVRNGIATAIVFAITPWVAEQGLYKFFVTVAVIAAVLILLTVPMILFGKQARRITAVKYREYALRQPLSRVFAP